MTEPLAMPRPYDPAQAERARERWLAAAADLAPEDSDLAGWMRAFDADPAGHDLIDALAGNSPFLGQILPREPAVVRRFVTAGADDAVAAIMDSLAAIDPVTVSTDQLMRLLRRAKRQAALAIAAADISGRWSVEQVTGALSELAETALRLASDHLLAQLVAAGKLIVPDKAAPARGSGLIVLAMGKLGARELNYSSDIDIIVFYDDGVVQMPQPDRMGQIFVRLARDLVRIMDERTAEGYVFRTDLRLRPDPGATPVAVSVSAAEIYYASVGQNWERAAMIKARPVAGDLAAGAGFIAFLRPFVWRRDLDFAAIQDIHSIKRQINAHKGHHSIRVDGHDIKVGRGGIREIEFFAQTQQLIFGGRDVGLRVTPTLRALEALQAAGRIPGETVAELSAAYRYLRRVEHRIQMIDDRQTHRVPETPEGVDHLATFLGYCDTETFRSDLVGYLATVEDHYAELFEDAAPLAPAGNLVFTGADHDPGTLETLAAMGFGDPARVISVVSDWHRGRYRATHANRARQLLTELVPTLLRELAATADPDVALLNMDEFLARLPAGVPLFSLFKANPWLLPLVAEILGGAPRLAYFLSRQPALLDAVLSRHFFDPLPGRDVLELDYARALAPASDLEEALALMRRWTNDHRFQAGTQMLHNIADGERCAPFLADLADVVLADLMRRIEVEFAQRHGRIPGGTWVVLAMGKLGSGQMTITSDIDLIVVYETPDDGVPSDGPRPLSPAEYYGRLTQRLIGTITAPMAGGKLYDVDMRLRPSGNSGPLATALSAFAAYQQNEAWTWEHMALTRARVAAGDPVLAQKVEAAVRAVLETPHDADKVLTDVAEMRRRVDREFPADSVWNLKYTRGGLFDVEFVAQYLQLRYGSEFKEILSTNMATTLSRAATLGLLAEDAAADLLTALSAWRRLQGYLRLTGEDAPRTGKVSRGVLIGLGRAAFPDAPPPVDIASLESQVAAIAQAAYHRYCSLIDEPATALTGGQTEDTPPK